MVSSGKETSPTRCDRDLRQSGTVKGDTWRAVGCYCDNMWRHRMYNIYIYILYHIWYNIDEYIYTYMNMYIYIYIYIHSLLFRTSIIVSDSRCLMNHRFVTWTDQLGETGSSTLRCWKVPSGNHRCHWRIYGDIYIYILVNCNDLTTTSLESWLVRGIIPKWP